jgi:D-3-phosphoglycerate dehydrogenase / 2-oxoglutarate reductase
MSGQVSGAGLDVFEQEPPLADNPLVLSEKVVCTPHLGASTEEAQSKVAIDIANQIVDYAVHEVINNSVNVPPVSIKVQRQLSPYIALSERLATFVSSISEFPIEEVEIDYIGDISEVETKILTQAILRNILARHVEGVNYVNAPTVARSRGIKIREVKQKEHEDYTSLLGIKLTHGKIERAAYGTLLGKKAPRLIRLDRIAVDADLAGNMLLTYHQDKPGIVGSIGTALANKGINIGGMHVGREAAGGLAIALLDVDGKVSDEVIKELLGVPEVIEIKRIAIS